MYVSIALFKFFFGWLWLLLALVAVLLFVGLWFGKSPVENHRGMGGRFSAS